MTDDATILICPRCEGAMQQRTETSGLVADWCPDCGSTWLARGQLERVRGPLGVGREDEAALTRGVRRSSKRLVCPTCDTETLQIGRRVLREVGHCPKCGGFLLPSAFSLFGASLPVPFESRLPISFRLTAVSTVFAVILALVVAAVILF